MAISIEAQTLKCSCCSAPALVTGCERTHQPRSDTPFEWEVPGGSRFVSGSASPAAERRHNAHQPASTSHRYDLTIEKQMQCE